MQARFIQLVVALSLTLLSQPARGVLVVVAVCARPLPALPPHHPLHPAARAPALAAEVSSESSTTSSPTAPCAGLAVLKVPRTGSTWLTRAACVWCGRAARVRAVYRRVGTPMPRTILHAGLEQGPRPAAAMSRARSRSLPCYWGWVGCNATRLKPRPTAIKAGVRPGGALAGFLINPMYAPGAIWNRVLTTTKSKARMAATKQASSRWPCPIYDASRGASALKHAQASTPPLLSSSAAALLVRLNMTLVTQATFPAAVSLDRGYLLLYEDLQTIAFLCSVICCDTWGLMPCQQFRLSYHASVRQSRRQALPPHKPHWQKASEDVCASLPPGNCERLRAGLSGRPCLLAQLVSKGGGMELPESQWHIKPCGSLMGIARSCRLSSLPLLQQRTIQQAAGRQTAARRTLYDLYNSRLPAAAETHQCVQRAASDGTVLIAVAGDALAWPLEGSHPHPARHLQRMMTTMMIFRLRMMMRTSSTWQPSCLAVGV